MSELNLKLIAHRKQIEKKIKDANYEYERAYGELDKLQNECTHEHAIISDGYQGGEIYYCHCSCPECGKKGFRYIPQYHMNKHNEYEKKCGRDTNLISLETAIKIGMNVKNDFMNKDKWWGQ